MRTYLLAFWSGAKFVIGIVITICVLESARDHTIRAIRPDVDAIRKSDTSTSPLSMPWAPRLSGNEASR